VLASYLRNSLRTGKEIGKFCQFERRAELLKFSNLADAYALIQDKTKHAPRGNNQIKIRDQRSP